MPKFVIEREVPGAGNLSDAQLRELSQKSVNVLKGMGPEIQWLHSYVTGDKVYCVYLAPDEATIQEHARRVGIPANRVSAVRRLMTHQRGVSASGLTSAACEQTARRLGHQHFLNRFLNRHGPTFQPGRHAHCVAQSLTRRSRLASSLACSAGVSGAPMFWRSAAAAPASRSERSASS